MKKNFNFSTNILSGHSSSFASSGSPCPESPKRIFALLSDAFGANGGIAKFNRDILSAMCASPLTSEVVAVPRHQPHSPGRLPEKLQYDTSGVGGKWRYIRALFRMLWRYSAFDVVLCGHINLLPFAFFAARIRRAPLWCVIHGIDAWQPNKRRMVNWIVPRLDGFISVSKVTQKRFIAWSGIKPEKGVLLPNCYDPATFFPGPKSKVLLDRYGLYGKTVLMTLGRLYSRERCKGFDEVIEAIPKLSKEIPDITYLIVGDGPDKNRLKQKTETLGIADRVIFAGYVAEEEKADHYRLADAFIMPSRGEGFGIVYLEAMACRVPVVGSKVDGSREALRDGLLGILVDPGNPSEINDGIILALNRAGKRVPEGLEYFGLDTFQQRVSVLLDGILTDDLSQ